MDYEIRTIPHDLQKYSTVGDYYRIQFADNPEAGTIGIVVSNLGDDRMEFLIGVHELIEAGLMHFAGIPLESSTEFDIEFEAARDGHEPRRQHNVSRELFMFRGRWYDIDAEPGDSPDSPYRKQHLLATSVEKMLAAELGVDWMAYTEACDNAGR